MQAVFAAVFAAALVVVGCLLGNYFAKRFPHYIELKDAILAIFACTVFWFWMAQFGGYHLLPAPWRDVLLFVSGVTVGLVEDWVRDDYRHPRHTEIVEEPIE